MIKIRIKLSGLHCEACAKIAKINLQEISGVSEASVSVDGHGLILIDHEISKDEVEYWEEAKFKKTHLWHGFSERRYSFMDLVQWAEHDLTRLGKKYPELV